MSGISVGVVLFAVILLTVSVLVAVCLVRRRRRRRRKTLSLHKMYDNYMYMFVSVHILSTNLWYNSDSWSLVFLQ